MIYHLNGILEHIGQGHVIIDVGNVGYQVNVPASSLGQLPKVGDRLKLFTYQAVREDDISLYGFLTKEERALFVRIISVNGIGPKVGLSLLSGFPIDRLVSAITQADVGLLSTIPGIGKRTAERIIVELKEKIGKAYAIPVSKMSSGLFPESTVLSEAMSALITLGYSPREAREAIMKCSENISGNESLEEIVKQALKVLV